MMKLFGKKKKGETKINISSKFIDALNYVPAEYVHTSGFMMTSDEALNEARDEVKTMKSIDPYIDDFRDPFIDASSLCEKEYGKKQYVEHMGTILHITEEAYDAGIKAINLQKEVEDELKDNNEEKEFYLKLLRENN